ncbi:hypothetical protein B0H63DRAFT_464718 [Podospora didyma]|uniref:AAA+ ATPase domain-containing protein n=1 Tax=Podospora didyma TaxID=330526 RepID=A0AAE0NZ57_9PEZI|nr:hypothetical protein B0H63DRAFT_464718 [Podospora didyma]
MQNSQPSRTDIEPPTSSSQTMSQQIYNHKLPTNAKMPDATDKSAPSVDDLLQTFITGLQALQRKISDQTTSDDSQIADERAHPDESDEAGSSPQKVLPATAQFSVEGEGEMEAWERKIWARDNMGRHITHREYVQHSNTRLQLSSNKPGGSGADDSPAVVFDFEQNGGTSKRIEVHSKHLIAALNKVNKHPSLALPSPVDCIVQAEPFPLLYHHLEDVRAEIARLNNPEADIDFKALEFAASTVSARWKAARSADVLGSGFVRYDTIWSLFHAGDLVVRKDDLGEWVFVLAEVNETKNEVRNADRADFGPSKLLVDEYIELVVWGLFWDGVEDKVRRQVASFQVRPFQGIKMINALPVFPLKYREGGGGAGPSGPDKFLASCAERGRKWFKWNAATVCLEYDGPAISYKGDLPFLQRAVGSMRDSSEKIKVKDRVIVDKEAKAIASSRITDLEGFIHDDDDPGSKPRAAELDRRENYQWDNLPSTATLTDEQAWLCPPAMGCCGLSTRDFHLVSVDKLREVQWNVDAMEHLVMDEEKKKMLQGLVGQHYNREQNKYGGDLIAGKGEGLVVLLYGSPGVGKTLTAESVAETVKKPLVALSIGDLAMDEYRLQGRLESEFKRAMSWDAILLLDEADVVLEARSFEDIRRNGIVSVFLRQLEYYRGVLFMTSNRINTMDVAFQSRIQIGIEFKDLDKNVRAQIWTKLLDLSDRSGAVGPGALREMRAEVHRLADWNLNGRQIRNVIKTAQGYAFNEFGVPGKMNYGHVRKAVQATMAFQRSFDDARSNLKTEQSVWSPYRGDADFF